MLYEKSRVSQYERKDRPGKVKTQINLGQSLKEKITELTTKNNGLTDKINEINPTQLKETISALQAENDILKENNKKLDDIPHIIDLQEQHKYELNKLNSQLLNEKDHVNRVS